MLEKLVQATVASLGYLENGVYFPEPDCLIGIHDLIRFLHNDKETLDARRICLVHNIVRNDLVPIMLATGTEENVFDSALRLTVNLCQPTIVAFGGKMPEADDIMQIYHDTETNLVNSLAAFANSKIFEKFATILKSFFSKDWTDRKESDKTNADRIIILIRYIFAIGMECPLTAEMPKIDPLIKERVIRAFLNTEMPSILMAVGCDRMEKELSVHIMAIFSLLLRSITRDEKQQEEDELRAIIERDKAVMSARRSQLSTSRTHLGANYALKNAALNPGKDLLVQNSNAKTPLDNLRSRKRNFRSMKRSQVCDVMESVFKPNKNAPADICQLMNSFCREFITKAFDKLMKATRETAFMTHQTGGVLAYSDVNYFFLSEYVLQFIRVARMPIEKITSIFSREFFHHIISQSDTYFELMKTDKFNITSYAVRAQHAISAYKEMMLLLNSLSKSDVLTDKEAFAYMTRTIYYNEEYREFGYLTLNRLQPQGMTRKLLDELIIASHYYILTMDHIIKTGQLQIVAKRKRIAKQRKKKAKQLENEAEARTKADQMTETQLEQLWEQLEDEIGAVLNGDIEANEDISPINILLKVDDTKHQIFAVLQIQRALRGRRVCDAIGLYKGARDLWPDSTFGEYTNTPEQDIPTIKDIYNMDLAEIATDYDAQMKEAYGTDTTAPDTNAEEEHVSVSDNEKENSENEEDKPKYQVAEINFDFNDYIRHFTKPDIIHWYIFALNHFDSNPNELNRAILKMLYRIGFQLESPSKLYSAILFQIFARVNVEIHKLPKEAIKKHQFYDIYKLGYHLLQKFFGHFKERGQIMVCELLFPKTNRECMEIEQGYGAFDEQQNNTTMLWTEELEEELFKFYTQYQQMEEKPEGINLFEYIQHNLSKERYPKQIQRQLKRMGLEYVKPKKPKKPKQEGEKRKSKKKSKKLDDDLLFASRTPSPTRSNPSGEESEAESSANESENNGDSGSDQQAKTPSLDEEPVFVGVERRLLLEETEFMANGPDFEVKGQSIEMEVEDTIAVLPEEQSQSMSWRQFDSDGGEESLETVEVRCKQKPKRKSPKKEGNKFRSLLKQPIEAEPINNEEQDENAMPTSQSQSQSHTFRRILDSDDSLDGGDVLESQEVDDEKETKKNAPKRFIESDDDEDEELVVSQKKRQRIVDSEDEE